MKLFVLKGILLVSEAFDGKLLKSFGKVFNVKFDSLLTMECLIWH